MNIIALVSAAIAAFIIFDAIRVYRKTPGTSWLTAFHDSATVAWTRLGSLGSSIAALIISGAASLGDPNISDAVKTAVTAVNPALLPFLPIAILVISEIGRRRSLGKK